MESLLADDSEITLEIQRLMLESCGLDVVTADSGTAAIKLARENKFFMIFIDIQMPDMNGFQAASVIRQNGVDTPIIALSADEIDTGDTPSKFKSDLTSGKKRGMEYDELC